MMPGALIAVLLVARGMAPDATADAGNLCANPHFESAAGSGPANYALSGNARWAWCGYADEIAARGVALRSFPAGGSANGEVSQQVSGIDATHGAWLRFTFRGRPESGFSVAHDGLAMRIDFLSHGGSTFLDASRRLIYREVLRDRHDFAVNGDDGKSGAAVWRTYELEEPIPFKEVDAVRVSVEMRDGNAPNEKNCAFYVQDFSLTQSVRSSDGRTEPKAKPASPAPPSTDGMIALGGRWFYQPAPGENVWHDGRLTVTEANAGRLFYRDDRLVNPFAANMTAWLRKGNLDEAGRIVTEERFVADNVTITFDNRAGSASAGYMALRVRNLPNHPTAKFPDTYGTQGYNPSYIQEHNDTYYLPLAPRKNPSAVAMNDRDANGALNMGPVGLAVNGVPFYNPFDANMIDAANIMDRCCGHPSPDNRYHYHKYPICVNTPFVDKGDGHSPIIGFALDGFPVYGPYESAGVMARDAKENPLNEFNAHYDAVRGWHYHVTPGKFPYLIGGYLGTLSSGAR